MVAGMSAKQPPPYAGRTASTGPALLRAGAGAGAPLPRARQRPGEPPRRALVHEHHDRAVRDQALGRATRRFARSLPGTRERRPRTGARSE